MKIYSFEFGSKPVKYELSEYNGKTFFGTMSRSFYPSKSMMTVENPGEFQEINNGTFFNPIITTKSKSRVEINQFSFNINVETGGNNKTDIKKILSATDDDDIAIVLIDTNVYRLVDYTMDNMSLNKKRSPVSIAKTWSGKTTDVALITVKRKYMVHPIVVVLILFNKLLKKYEYISIVKTSDGLKCVNDTEKVGKNVIDTWVEYDEKNNKPSCRIHEYIPRPTGKFYITKTEYEEELKNLIDDNLSGIKPVIALINNEEPNHVSKVIKDIFRGKKNALTWYRVPIIKGTTDGSAIELNFTMDETGIVRR